MPWRKINRDKEGGAVEILRAILSMFTDPAAGLAVASSAVRGKEGKWFVSAVLRCRKQNPQALF